jgi:hypothetical protein
MLRTVLAASFLAGANGALCSPTDNCPKLSDNLYCPVNDVTEHGDSNRDVKEIKDKLSETPVNYAAAKTVYTDGVYSSKGGGTMRTLQGLAQKDMTGSSGSYTNAWYTGSLDLMGSINGIWDEYMLACLDNTGICNGKSDDFRKYIINKCAIGIVMGYTTYEMGAAVWKAADGSLTDTGAPYAWDEAAAFFVGNVAPVLGDGYTGSAPGNLYSPYEFLWKRDIDFPTGTQGHTESIPILNYGLLNIRTYSATNLAAAQLGMYKIMAIGAIRSALKYSWKAYGGTGGSYSDKYHAEGWAYWRSASGYIATIDKPAVQAVDALLALTLTNIPSTTPCTIKTTLEAVYPALGITCAMVGKWKDAESGSCLDSVCDDTGNSNTLISGSTSYVDMCKGVASEGSHSAPAVATFAAAAAGAACSLAY